LVVLAPYFSAAVAAQPRDQQPSPRTIHTTRRDQFAAERDDLTRRWNRFANLRLFSFVVALGCAAGGIWWDQRWLFIVAAALLVLFGGLVRHHLLLGRARREAMLRVQISNDALLRIDRAWDKLPQRHTYAPDPDHPFAGDLDLFGHASVLHLLDTAKTPLGEQTLRDWLLAPASPATLRERQAAVRELAPLIDWREELTLRALLHTAPDQNPEPFLQWAEGERWLSRQRFVVIGGRISVVLFWVTLAAQFLGLISFPLCLLFLAAIILINQRYGTTANEVIASAATQHQALLQYASLLQHVSEADFEAPLLRDLQKRLGGTGQPAHEQIHRLHRLTTFWIPNSSIGHLPFQLASLWDLQLLDVLERWQAQNGRLVRAWLTSMAEIEALVALAGLAHDQPGWTFPTLDDQRDTLTASGIGHPLLQDDVRVVNDVEVGPPGTFLLVTGSNMSGKSTLLRSLGVNIVLAGAGGPACASNLALPPLRLWTSVRVQDSLERGISFFMAELQRLKQIVDVARDTKPDDPRLFYLLDEILQGTNTAERQIAARRIIRFLVDQGAIGAVSTHDLTLAEGPELTPAARPIHFAETVSRDGEGPPMTFDYKIRPGLATSTNALRLMELIGFDLPTSR
jgi:hypothetical protein